jgi:signal peptidase I
MFKLQSHGESNLMPQKFVASWQVYTMALTWLNKFLKILFWSLVLWLFVRLFLVQGFKVPTASMNNTLREGDYILANKLAYGARIPITPLSLHIAGEKYFLDVLQLPYLRIPGYAAVKRNDILIFNLPTENQLPVDERREYVKRCIGLPGESISMEEGDVYINQSHKPLAAPPGQLRRYAVSVKGFPFPRDLYLTASDAQQISKSDTVTNVQQTYIQGYSPTYFPHAPQIKWNPDQFGPLWIPKKGTMLKLDRATLPLYQSIIELYEGNVITFKDEAILINGKVESYYTFRMDYYFVMGDNRYNSIDSRFWGFVPEDHLIGKALSLVF